MKREQTAAKGGDKGEAEGGAGKVTYRLWINYKPACYVDGEHREKPPDPADAHIEAAYFALLHLETLFRLLSFVDGRRLTEELGEDDITFMFESLGQLGRGIVTAAYTSIDDARSAS